MRPGSPEQAPPWQSLGALHGVPSQDLFAAICNPLLNPPTLSMQVLFQLRSHPLHPDLHRAALRRWIASVAVRPWTYILKHCACDACLQAMK